VPGGCAADGGRRSCDEWRFELCVRRPLALAVAVARSHLQPRDCKVDARMGGHGKFTAIHPLRALDTRIGTAGVLR